MSIFEINWDNITELIDPVPGYFAGEIEREYIRGMAATEEDDGSVCAAVFWELKNVESETKPKEAELLWFYAGDEESGSEVLREMEAAMEEEDVTRVFFELAEYGDTEMAAFKKAGYSVNVGAGRDVIVTVEEIAAVKPLQKKPESYIKPVAELTTRQFKAGIMSCVFHERYGLLEDLPFLPQSVFEQELSCCVMMDEKVEGLFLVRELGEGNYRVELLFAMQPDAQIHLLNMLCYSAREICGIRPGSDTVVLCRHNDISQRLVDKLFPGKKGVSALKAVKEL